jgi:hypothetical protein
LLWGYQTTGLCYVQEIIGEGIGPPVNEELMTSYRAKPQPIVTYARPKSPPVPAPPKQRITEEHAPPVVPAAVPAAPPLVPSRRQRQACIVKDEHGEALMPHIFLFGEGWVRTALHEKASRAVEALGMRFYRVAIPDVGWRYWFISFNDGTPLDPTLESRLVARLIEKGIYLPRGRLLPGQLPKP